MPKIKWNEAVNEYLAENGVANWREIARDRKKWKFSTK